jgi:hypothetical protein
VCEASKIPALHLPTSGAKCDRNGRRLNGDQTTTAAAEKGSVDSSGAEDIDMMPSTEWLFPASFWRRVAPVKHSITYAEFCAAYDAECAAPAASADAPAMAHPTPLDNDDKDDSSSDDFFVFAAYSIVRALLSPLLEQLFLADRALFLANGAGANRLGTARVQVLPVFDPVLSPRFYALRAERRVS